MKIATILHGGLGDQLLANRFTPAIIDCFDVEKIDIVRPYLNYYDEHNDLETLNFIKSNFYKFYNEIKFCKITNASNTSNYIDKCPKIQNEFEDSNQYDKIYNFIPDNLNFLNYNELQINKYYNFFPTPHVKIDDIKINNYIYFSPAARENQHSLHKFPLDFAKKIVDTFNGKHKLICPVSKNNFFLKDYCEKIGVETYECDLYQMLAFAKNCKMAICCDSGPKFFPMHFDKPVFIITGFFDQNGPNYHFLVRWLLNKKNIFPMNIDPRILLNATDIICSNIQTRLNINFLT